MEVNFCRWNNACVNWYFLLLCSGLCSNCLCFLFSEAPSFGRFGSLKFKFWGACACGCVSLCECHPLGAKKASVLWIIIAEGKREQILWVKMNYFNGNSSLAATTKLYWTDVVSGQDGCVWVCVYSIYENVPTGSEGSLHLWFDLFCKSLTLDLNHRNALLSGSISCLSWYLQIYLFWMNVFILTHKLGHHFPDFMSCIFSDCFPSPVWDSSGGILCAKVHKTILCRLHSIGEPKQKH